MQPKVGIVIPAYLPTEQHLLFLDECIQSVLDQTYKNISIVVVYNGPIIKNYTHCNVIDLKLKTSAAVARNVGAAYLNTCDYFCFLDADDLFVPTKLEKQIEIILSENIHFCFTEPLNINIDKSNRKEEYMYTDICEIDQIKNILPKINILPLSSSMIEKNAFFSCGMFPCSIEYQIKHTYGHLNSKNATYEDYLLWVTAIEKNYKFKKLKDRLTLCRVGSTVER